MGSNSDVDIIITKNSLQMVAGVAITMGLAHASKEKVEPCDHLDHVPLPL